MNQESLFYVENKQEYITLGILQSGEKVIIRPTSHIHDNEELEQYLVQALQKITSNNQNLIEGEVDFGETIGMSRCVETTDADKGNIVFAQRPGRNGGYTRFVKHRDLESTSKLTVILTKDKKTDSYLVLTTYIGEKAEPEPWDYRATDASLPFWKTHALVYGAEPILKETETEKQLW